MGRNKKVCCNICLRVMRSDALKGHLEVHEKREETSKSHHQFYNYNIFKNIKQCKEFNEKKRKNDDTGQYRSTTKRKCTFDEWKKQSEIKQI